MVKLDNFMTKHLFPIWKRIKKVDTFSITFNEEMNNDDEFLTFEPDIIWNNLSTYKKIIKIIFLKGFSKNEIEHAKKQVIKNHFGDKFNFGPILYSNLINKPVTVSLSEISHELKMGCENLFILSDLVIKNINGVETNVELRLNIAKDSPEMANELVKFSNILRIHNLEFFLQINLMPFVASITDSKRDKMFSIVEDLLSTELKLFLSKTKLIEALATVSHIKLNDSSVLNTIEWINYSMALDSYCTYLKSSLEKNIYFLSYIFDIDKQIDNSKKYVNKINKLDKNLPHKLLNSKYWKAIRPLLDPEHLKELNNIRNSIIHKRGSHENKLMTGLSCPYELSQKGRVLYDNLNRYYTSNIFITTVIFFIYVENCNGEFSE